MTHEEMMRTVDQAYASADCDTDSDCIAELKDMLRWHPISELKPGQFPDGARLELTVKHFGAYVSMIGNVHEDWLYLDIGDAFKLPVPDDERVDVPYFRKALPGPGADDE